MQTVEVVDDFYSLKFPVQQPINPHTLTNQFKQVLRRFSELTRVALTGPFARRMHPFKEGGRGPVWGPTLFVFQGDHTRGFEAC